MVADAGHLDARGRDVVGVVRLALAVLASSSVIAALIVASRRIVYSSWIGGPPFNTAAMIALLMGVGLVTGAFYLVSGDVYGTVVFHNFLALFGVLRATERAGEPAHDTPLQAPLVLMAVATLIVLLLVHGSIRRVIPRPETGRT